MKFRVFFYPHELEKTLNFKLVNFLYMKKIYNEWGKAKCGAFAKCHLGCKNRRWFTYQLKKYKLEVDL